MAKRKNQSLYEQVVALEEQLPKERKRLTDMEEAHKKAHAAQIKRISTMEQKLASGRDQLLRELFQQKNVGEYGIQAVYHRFGVPIPKETKPAPENNLRAGDKETV